MKKRETIRRTAGTLPGRHRPGTDGSHPHRHGEQLLRRGLFGEQPSGDPLRCRESGSRRNWPSAVTSRKWMSSETTASGDRSMTPSDLKSYRLPGRDLPPHSPFQFVEKEYMLADEYDLLIKNPLEFMFDRWLPRILGRIQGTRVHPLLHGLPQGRDGPGAGGPDHEKPESPAPGGGGDAPADDGRLPGPLRCPGRCPAGSDAAP